MRAARALGHAERALLPALGVATLATTLFVAQNRLLPNETPTTFALSFLKWGLLFYLTWLPPALLAGALLLRATRRGWLFRLSFAALAIGFLIVLVVLNLDGLRAMVNLGGPARFRILTPVAFLLACAGLLAVGGLPPNRPWAGRALLLLAPAAATVAFWPPARSEGPPAATRLRPGPSDPRPPLLLVGIDGADWQWMEPLLRRGELPTIAALRARGAFGPLKSVVPTSSPAIWNTVATGRPADVHGIVKFTSPRVAGVDVAFRDTKKPRGLGFPRFNRWLRRSRRLTKGPLVSTARQVPAYWEIASAHGQPVSVVNWWGTWPADPLLGHIVSERVHYFRQAARGAPPEDRRLTFPPELHAEILPLVMRPDDVTFEQAQPFMDVSREEFEAMMARPFEGKTIESEFKHFYSMFETDRRVALALVDASRRAFGKPSDLLVLFRIVDIASHSSLRESELVEDHLDAKPEDVRRFARVVSEAYRCVDRALGQLLAAYGEVNVVVLSDHGFWLEDRGAGNPYMYHHRRAPPGILILAGPAFSPGKLRGLGVYDILPLLLALKGLPVADDLEGRIPEEAFAPEWLSVRPPTRVATYGRRRSLTVGKANAEADEEMLERLRALGYVK